MLRINLKLIAVSLLLSASFYPQSNLPGKPEPFKFAEFRQRSSSEVGKTVEKFCQEIRKDKELTGYIINYGSPSQIKIRRNDILKYFRPCVGDYDPARKTWVDGPFEKRIRTVFWIIPRGAGTPEV